MKNILIIAYYYPPLGGAGVQRSLKFSKHLSEKGYNVFVLTVANESGIVLDKSLKLEEDEAVKIYRAKQKNSNIVNKIINKKSSGAQVSNNNVQKIDNTNSIKFRAKKNIKNFLLNIYRSMYIPDDKISWKKDAVSLGLKIVKEQNIDVIYSTSAPYTGHLIAYEIKKKCDVKWIADFRDQWATNPFVDYPFLIKKINYIMEKKVVQSSDNVISVSKPIIDDFTQRYKNQPKKKFEVITNGYGEDDFQGYNLGNKSSKYVITYNGTLYGNRSPQIFLNAIDSLLMQKKIGKEDILIRFVGQIGRDALVEINNFIYKYNDVIELIDYLPHRESIKQLEQSSALLLIIESGIGSEGIYTGKIFEYIRSGRNIIAIVPEGVARDLINETNTGFCCYPSSIIEVENAILNSYLIWKGEKPVLDINWEKVKQYERGCITNQLIELIQ